MPRLRSIASNVPKTPSKIGIGVPAPSARGVLHWQVQLFRPAQTGDIGESAEPVNQKRGSLHVRGADTKTVQVS